MDLHPTSKKRIVGDDVLFCCAAIGNPLPEFYEWYVTNIKLYYFKLLYYVLKLKIFFCVL